jgi:hypothetical protein
MLSPAVERVPALNRQALGTPPAVPPSFSIQGLGGVDRPIVVLLVAAPGLPIPIGAVEMENFCQPCTSVSVQELDPQHSGVSDQMRQGLGFMSSNARAPAEMVTNHKQVARFRRELSAKCYRPTGSRLIQA